ncbi:MAG: hypothetical protein ACJ72O_06905 [Marmoricola sp.]
MTTVPAPSAHAAIITDLLFWTAASSVLLLGSGRVAGSWGAPEPALVVVCTAVLVSGVAGMVLRAHLRGSTVLRVFGWANLVIAPVLLAIAVLDLLGLTRAGNAALSTAAGVAALFGVWQVVSGTLTNRRRS